MGIRINSFRSDPTGWIGAAIMLGFAAWAGWRWFHFGLLFFALTAVRDLAAAWFLFIRRPDRSGRKFGVSDTLAYASCAMPFLYASGDQSFEAIAVSNILTIVGFWLATTALFDLGASFGISPANRFAVNDGIYGVLRHPMYVGYAVTESGFVLANPMNALIYFISLTLYWQRARKESQYLRGYVSAP